MDFTLFGRLGNILLSLLPLAVWCAWWLGGVNWQKTWPVLARGAWAPVVLLMFITATVWSRITPVPCNCLGFLVVPNFLWQLGAVSGLVALALFCGWLQGQLGWTPAGISLEPPPVAHGHDHGHHH